MKKRPIIVLICLILLFFILSVIVPISIAESKNHSTSDGKDGKNVVVEVSEDGYVVVNGQKTEYRFSKKDCSVKIAVENDAYGTVYGNGFYAYGDAVVLSAKPNDNGVFVCWKNSLGKVISTKNDLLVVVDNGETEYTATFGCKPECVKAKINVKFDETSLPSAVYTGEKEVPLTDGVTLKFDGYGENYLILYTVSADVFQKPYEEINAMISNGEITSARTISYEEYVSLYDKNAIYETDSTNFYYFVSGRPNERHSVTISSSHTSGNVSVSGGDALSATNGYLAGTVLRLKASPKTQTVNGISYEISDFAGWYVNGKKISDEKNISYKVSTDAEIKAVFSPRTKLRLRIESGEDGLTPQRYKEIETPSKAMISIDGNDFETAVSFTDGVATIDLGYFTSGETFSLQLRLDADAKKLFTPAWKYIHLSYEFNGTKIGEGYSLTFFVFDGENEEISVRYVRTGNYYTSAKDETGKNSEYLSSSGYGLSD